MEMTLEDPAVVPVEDPAVVPVVDPVQVKVYLIFFQRSVKYLVI